MTMANAGIQVRPDAMSGLSQMLMKSAAQTGESPKAMVSLQEDLDEISNVPGGQEMLFTMAAEEMMKAQGITGKGGKKIRLFDNKGGPQEEFAEGGLAQAAERTRKGGRGNDDVLLHVSPDEYSALTGMWGEPDINPNTGIPEYGFLSKVFKKLKHSVKKVVSNRAFQVIAPIALNFFVPGLGMAIGGAMGASGMAAAAIGGAVISGGLAGVGGARGRDFFKAAGLGAAGGALSQAGTTAQAAKAAEATAATTIPGGMAAAPPGAAPLLDVPIGDLGAASTIGDLGAAEFGAGISPTYDPALAGEYGGGRAFMAGATPQIPGLPAPAPSGGLTLGGAFGAVKENALPLALLAGSLGGGGAPEEPGQEQAPVDPSFYESLPQLQFDRQLQQPSDVDFYTYGQAGKYSPEYGFYDEPGGTTQALVQDPITKEYITQAELDQRKGASAQQALQPAQGYAGGGYAEGGDREQHYYKGAGSGRDDTIDSLLSDGEYVFDAESVAMLGDGSGDEGARRLDEMRSNLRKHKAKNMAKGKFSKNAKKPMSYLRSAGG